jgi:drug/metabolite transporter (DMT)-like permease
LSINSHQSPASCARAPTVALIIATLLWGCGFVWAKRAGEAVNALSGAGDRAPLGPIWVLIARFLMAGILWFIIFPGARRGWSWRLVGRAIVLGGTLALGMIVQHLGLDRTTEATSAFLTSLTILFVPLMMTLVLRRPPPRSIWIGVVLAAAGVWIMTGATSATFGVGELLGLACAFAYSINIIAVNLLVTKENVLPITAGQFLVLALICSAIALVLPHGPASLSPGAIVNLFSHRDVGLNVALLGTLVTMGAFGLQFRYQPRIDPTRATLLYLMEPIFAAAFAYIAIHRGMTLPAVFGAALILVANALVELLQSRRSNSPAIPVID